MQFLSLWVVLLSLAARVLADVFITSPTLGQSFSGSGGSATVTIKWDDSTSDDTSDSSLSNVDLYAIKLCTGENNNIQGLKTFTTSVPKGSLSYDAIIEQATVPNGVYFLQVFARFKEGYTIHYTNRFTLSGMTGSASTYTFSASLFSVTGANPLPQLSVGTTTSIDSRSFTVPYTEQTGKTRYAPMQTQPGPSITYSMYLTRHSKSAFTPYSTFGPSPNVDSTLTPGWSYPVTSKVNTAAVAGYPTYFYPALSRVVAASMSSANKKRWL